MKGVEGLTFEEAKYRLIELIGTEAERFAFLDDSDRLSANEKEKYRALIALNNGKYAMEEASYPAFNCCQNFIPALWTENSNTWLIYTMYHWIKHSRTITEMVLSFMGFWGRL